jgi:hypothetical protein
MPGLGGQNQDVPVSAFVNHVVVRIGTDYYDPSYGLIHRGATLPQALLAFQNDSIAGFYKRATINNTRAILIRKPGNSPEIMEDPTRSSPVP